MVKKNKKNLHDDYLKEYINTHLQDNHLLTFAEWCIQYMKDGTRQSDKYE